MIGRLCPRTSPVSLLCSSAMSTARISSTLSAHSSSQVDGNGTISNVNSATEQGGERNGSARTPVRRNLLNQNPIFRHLGLHRGTTSYKSNDALSSGNKNYFSATDTLQQATTSVSSLRISVHDKDWSSPCVSSGATLVTQQQCSSTTQNDQQSEPSLKVDNELSYNTECTGMLEENSLPTSFGKQKSSQSRKPKSFKNSLKLVGDSRDRNRKPEYHKRRTSPELFDIAQLEQDTETIDPETEDLVFLRSSPGVGNISKEVEVRLIEEPTLKILRPGMVLLKNYISPDEQVSVFRKCREFGLGRGGFYQPGYKGGAKLRLHMMCLGLDWDPQTRKYQKYRRIDRAKPPDIPSEFHLLVTRAMQDSLSLIRENSRACNAEDILPQMTPNICIANFYTETGKLGLHQDRDESAESLSKGLPVVSFSVGDAAEFLYGDQRDANKAEKLVLESGDVLIFGGESRHVFHGISSIIPDSAPAFLLEQTKRRPVGRLNLTFRQY